MLRKDMMAPFVGRQAEFGVLRACLADARAGRPRVVLIHGPAGIGKTALLDRLLAEVPTAAKARDPSVVVLRASGEENEQLLAYGLLEQLIRSAGTRARPPAAAIGGPGAGPGRLIDPITAGTRWLEFLDSMAGSVVVLAVDDANWADRPSLQALVFALRRLVADRVLAMFTTRDDGIDGLPESLARLITGHLGTVVRLSGLTSRSCATW